MRNLAVSCGDGVSHEKFGDGGRRDLESFFILSSATWCSFNGRPKAFAIDWYVMSSWLQTLSEQRSKIVSTRPTLGQYHHS